MSVFRRIIGLVSSRVQNRPISFSCTPLTPPVCSRGSQSTALSLSSYCYTEYSILWLYNSLLVDICLGILLSHRPYDPGSDVLLAFYPTVSYCSLVHSCPHRCARWFPGSLIFEVGDLAFNTSCWERSNRDGMAKMESRAVRWVSAVQRR